MKTLLIINPVAGHGRAGKYKDKLVELFSENGMEVTAVTTQKRCDAEVTARLMGGANDLVVCVGGDGTLNEVITGLMKLDDRPRLGYIPTGTTNDFATTLGISHQYLEAARSIIDGRTIMLDVGAFDGKSPGAFDGKSPGAFNFKSFAYVASFGTLSSVAYVTTQGAKNKIGRLAYFLEGFKLLLTARSRHVRIETADAVIEDDFLFGAVSNTTTIAGVIKFDESQISLSDGMFEVTLIRSPRGMAPFLKMVGEVLFRGRPPVYVQRFQAAELEFYCGEGLEWCLDGEDGGIHEHTSIHNEPQSLALVI